MKNIINNPIKTIVNAFGKFRAGTLDLKTAFWGFGVVGSIIAFVLLLAIIGKDYFIIFFFILDFYILYKVTNCLINHRKEMARKKQSDVFGIVVSVLLVIAFFSLFGLSSATF